VFVVMPADRVHSALGAREFFERFNVGLISHDPSGRSDVLIPSRKRVPTARYRFIMALGLLIGSLLRKDSNLKQARGIA
jgi:hypothetical protein